MHCRRTKKENLRKEWQEKGMDVPEEIDKHLESKFDSNTITPGTEFMDRLSKAIKVKKSSLFFLEKG